MEKKEATSPVEDSRIPLHARSGYHTKQRVEFLEAEVKELQDKITLLREQHVTLLGFFRELCYGFDEFQKLQQGAEE
tara:strand:- start:359 stop:589 length:231 start_codon:yes stop_codon:yes gene_type:complete